MDYDDSWRMIEKAAKRRNDSRYWDQYIAIYPRFNQETFLTFEEFCNLGKKTDYTALPRSEDVYAEVAKIREEYFNGTV